MGGTTHLAGPPVCVGGRVVQRCCVCGEKLCDSGGAMAPVGPDGKPPVFATWRQGALVNRSGEQPTRDVVAGHWDEPGDLPADFCFALVE